MTSRIALMVLGFALAAGLSAQSTGASPLHTAAQQGDTDEVMHLIACGSDSAGRVRTHSTFPGGGAWTSGSGGAALGGRCGPRSSCRG